MSLARRTSYSLINTGLRGTNGLNPQTRIHMSYMTYVIQRLLYGLEVVRLNKTQLQQLEQYHLNTLRQIQSLPKGQLLLPCTCCSVLFQLKPKYTKRQLSLLYAAIIASENQYLQKVIQRQLACAFDIVNSFFHIISQVLEKYDLPTVSQLLTLNISKLQWKTTYNKAIEQFWTRQCINDIKTKKTLRFLNIKTLRSGITHLVWSSIESEAEVNKGVIKSRVF